MARPRARTKASGKAAASKLNAADNGWTRLTWDDLERWAGSRSVTRGRSYQRGGRVRDLGLSDTGILLANVTGTARYVTSVSNSPRPSFLPMSRRRPI